MYTTLDHRRVTDAIQGYLLDIPLIGEEHGQPVDTNAPAGRRRQSVLHRHTEVLIMDLQTSIAVSTSIQWTHMDHSGGMSQTERDVTADRYRAHIAV